MNAKEIQALIDQTVEFGEYKFQVLSSDGEEFLALRGFYSDYDYYTKKNELQFTRKWNLSKHMTKSEIIQTVFKCCLTSYEHRCREAFKYRGKRVFGPHFDVEALHAICKTENLDYRETPVEVNTFGA